MLLRSLEYLQEVAKTQSINKAADNLYISKSALSTAIKNLENEFGVPLLNRSVQGVTLTEAGKMVTERASLIFNILNGMKDECKSLYDGQHEINFFLESSFSNSVFPQILVELKQQKPNTYITVNSVPFEEIFRKCKEDKNNVGLFLMNGWNGTAPTEGNLYQDIIFRHIDSFPVCIATAKYSKHIPLNVTELSYADIKDIPQIELTKGARTYSTAWDETVLLSENYVMSTDNNNVYYQAILSDIGIGCMLPLGAQFGLVERDKLRFIPLKDGQQIDLWLVSHKEANEANMDFLCGLIRNIMKN